MTTPIRETVQFLLKHARQYEIRAERARYRAARLLEEFQKQHGSLKGSGVDKYVGQMLLKRVEEGSK